MGRTIASASSHHCRSSCWVMGPRIAAECTKVLQAAPCSPSIRDSYRMSSPHSQGRLQLRVAGPWSTVARKERLTSFPDLDPSSTAWWLEPEPLSFHFSWCERCRRFAIAAECATIDYRQRLSPGTIGAEKVCCAAWQPSMVHLRLQVRHSRRSPGSYARHLAESSPRRCCLWVYCYLTGCRTEIAHS